jgi:tetratricopeptide (TPR) repeat protein
METIKAAEPVSAEAEAAHFNSKGIGQTGAEQYDKAIESFTKALTLEPGNAGFLFNRAEAYRRDGQNGRARADLEAALAKEGESPDILLALGLVAYEDDDYDAASDWYRKAIALRAGFSEAWNNLGVVEFRRGRYREAREDFGKAVSLHADYAEAWFNLADTCDELGLGGERKRALAELERLKAGADEADEPEPAAARSVEKPEFRKPEFRAKGFKKPEADKKGGAGSGGKRRR